MGFKDSLKRSLGFEEDEPIRGNHDESVVSSLSDMFNNLTKSPQENKQQNNNQQQNPRPTNEQRPARSYNPRPNPTPSYERYDDDFVITPEQSFYEIVLIRPKTIDDINYVVDQVIEEKNPVILDLSFLAKESAANFKLAGDKIKQMRTNYGVQALLLSRTEDKELLIVSPKKVRIINKG